MKKQSLAKQTAILGLMLAITIVLLRILAIPTPIVRISLGFIPVALVAAMYGPLWASAVFAVADFLGAMFVFPAGPYFWGFTVTAALTGLVLGLFLYKRPKSWLFAVLPALIICIGGTLVLDTFWLYQYLGMGFLAMLPARLIKTVVMIPIYIAVLRFIQTKFDKIMTSLNL